MPVSLTPPQNERLRAILNEIRPQFKSSAALARKLGVAQPTLARFLKGQIGTSVEVAHKVAELTGMEMWELLGYPSPKVKRWRDLDGYEEALQAARTMANYPAEIWDQVGNIEQLGSPSRVLPGHLLVLAGCVVQILNMK